MTPGRRLATRLGMRPIVHMRVSDDSDTALCGIREADTINDPAQVTCTQCLEQDPARVV